MEKTLKEMTDQELVVELHKRCHEILRGELKAEDDGIPLSVTPHPYPKNLDVGGMWELHNEIHLRIDLNGASNHLSLLPAAGALAFCFFLEDYDEGNSHTERANNFSRYIAKTVVDMSQQAEEFMNENSGTASNTMKEALLRKFLIQKGNEMADSGQDRGKSEPKSFKPPSFDM